MAQGNKGFADLVRSGAGGARLPPRTGILGERENRLAELAAGNMVNRVHELVDPAICRIWSQHNRDYAALTPASCADLIESFKAQRRQEVPAIVRRVSDDPNHKYEVICGARRHWTATWLRAHDHPQFRFLIEPRELTDEEAFRLADLENRHRQDLTDHERAADYLRALDRHYEGSQQRMAERLEVSRSWLSRYLELARLPDEVLRCYPSRAELKISHAAVLAPLMKVPRTHTRLMEIATLLAAEQALRRQQGKPLSAATVTQRLAEAGRDRPASGARQDGPEIAIKGERGQVVLRGQRMAAGNLVIHVPTLAAKTPDAVLTAVRAFLDRLAQDS